MTQSGHRLRYQNIGVDFFYMRRQMLFETRLSVVVLICLSVTACDGTREAWRHRVRGEPAVITFGCDDFIANEQGHVASSSGQVSLEVGILDRETGTNEVGDLFSDWPGQTIGVTFSKPYPMDVIKSDTRNLLTFLGYAVGNARDKAGPAVEIAVYRLASGQEQGGWTELKGTTWSEIDLRVTVRRGSSVEHTWEFSQREEIRVTYFLASQMESTLAECYCRLLDDIKALFRTAEFRDLVSESN